jgi:hypothetical protein
MKLLDFGILNMGSKKLCMFIMYGILTATQDSFLLANDGGTFQTHMPTARESGDFLL